jgi:hypothetical protein
LQDRTLRLLLRLHPLRHGLRARHRGANGIAEGLIAGLLYPSVLDRELANLMLVVQGLGFLIAAIHAAQA